ncbi:hypothetical protein BC834DRAFT_885593 [Gloeopeniophorella convolvens]|nr:hypothetical protein BC834DRAFT_885593 [Gloeopeniophorella convolvens]
MSLTALGTYWNTSAPEQARITASVAYVENMLFMSHVSSIVYAAALILLAIAVVAVLLGHWGSWHIQFRMAPHTMAGQGMLLAGGSDVARMLDDPNMTRREIKAVLRKHYWALVDGKVRVDDGAAAFQAQQDSETSEMMDGSDATAQVRKIAHNFRLLTPVYSYYIGRGVILISRLEPRNRRPLERRFVAGWGCLLVGVQVALRSDFRPGRAVHSHFHPALPFPPQSSHSRTDPRRRYDERVVTLCTFML